jgi:hypothetical protein
MVKNLLCGLSLVAVFATTSIFANTSEIANETETLPPQNNNKPAIKINPKSSYRYVRSHTRTNSNGTTSVVRGHSSR